MVNSEKLASEYGFDRRAGFYLDSISGQLSEATGQLSALELRNVCEIAREYENPVEAMRLLDLAVADRIKDRRNPLEFLSMLRAINQGENRPLTLLRNRIDEIFNFAEYVFDSRGIAGARRHIVSDINYHGAFGPETH